MQPASDVRLWLIDDAGILFAERAQSVYALNTVAAFLWLCLEDGADTADMARRLTEELKVPATEAAAHVELAMAQWRRLGLLAGTPRPALAPRPDAEMPLVDARLETAPVCRRYSVLDRIVEVRFASAEADALAHPLLAHFATDNDRPADRRLDIIPDGTGWQVVRDGRRFTRCRDIAGLAPAVKRSVVHTAMTAFPYIYYLHAGAVGVGDGCVLLSGAAGAGKSSLTAGLVHAGYSYFSDEMALLEAPDFEVRPLPVAFCVKDTGWALIEALYPALADIPWHRREDDKLVKYLPPPLPLHPHDDRRPVRAVVFPRYAPDAETVLRPVSRVEALTRLMDECLAIPAELTHAKVEALARWIGGVDCYELPLSSLDDAVAAFEAAFPRNSGRNPSHTGSAT